MMLQVLINPKGDTIENEIESEVSAEQTAYAWGGFSPRSGSVLTDYRARIGASLNLFRPLYVGDTLKAPPTWQSDLVGTGNQNLSD
jgi:hypothetical protein